MSHRLLLISALVLIGLSARAQGFSDEERDWGVAPTQILRRPPYSAPTPREIPGARVVRTSELKAMLAGAEPPVLIDVASGEGRFTIEGARWLGGAGRGASYIDPLQAELGKRLAEISGGNKAKPLAFFCVSAQCWLSYNAALRAVALGYAQVYWYRGGVEAWRAAGLPVARTLAAPAGAAGQRN